ncbi:hypothetical protein D3C73_687820 [compost metagenome]
MIIIGELGNLVERFIVILCSLICKSRQIVVFFKTLVGIKETLHSLNFFNRQKFMKSIAKDLPTPLVLSFVLFLSPRMIFKPS